MTAQKYFKAHHTDVILSSFPKSGTTWIQALLSTAINRHRSDVNPQHALETCNPHDLIPFIEVQMYTKKQAPDLSKLPPPRLFATHVPFQSLPTSITDSGCRVVYLCRKPKDTFISAWHFTNKIRAKANLEAWPLEKDLDYFCKGYSVVGPYWEHVLGYWKVHLERPQQVLFMKYEELKEDGVAQLKRLAEFVGCPFSEEEQKEGVVEDILRLCAIDNLSKLDVNRIGEWQLEDFIRVDKSAFFRRGAVGDWKNHLTPEMVDRLDKITEQKFRGSGLTL